MTHINWVIPRFDELVGNVPAPGCKWTFADADISRSMLMQLSEQSLISRVDYDHRDGTIWETSRTYPTLMMRAARSHALDHRDVDEGDLFLALNEPVERSIDDIVPVRG